MSIQRFLPTLLLCIVVLGGRWAAAQEPAYYSSPAPVQSSTPSMPVIPTESAADKEAVVAAHLLLGMQTGIRAQVSVLRGDGRSLVAEAYYGLIFTRDMGSAEGGGLGARAYFRKTSRDGSNSLVLGPGVDVFEHFQNHHLVMVAPSMELSWVRGFENGAGWESGLNIGIGFGVSSSETGDEHVDRITPMISFFSGLRY